MNKIMEKKLVKYKIYKKYKTILYLIISTLKKGNNGSIATLRNFTNYVYNNKVNISKINTADSSYIERFQKKKENL